MADIPAVRAKIAGKERELKELDQLMKRQELELQELDQQRTRAEEELQLVEKR